jgi:predicted ATP-grasp superfamily ATP-dependent carboligase
MSAVFITDRSRRVRRRITTRQLIGTSFLHAEGFQWCGNVGPIGLDRDLETRLNRLATALSDGCSLRGVWGLDFLLDTQEANPAIVPIEINPRWPGSAELFELLDDDSLLQEHLAAFGIASVTGRRDGVLQGVGVKRPADTRTVARGILFAPFRCRLPNDGLWRNPDRHARRAREPFPTDAATGHGEAPADRNEAVTPFEPARPPESFGRLEPIVLPSVRFADVPPHGAVHRRSEPIVSFFVFGASEAAAEAALFDAAAWLRSQLIPVEPGN